MSNKTIKEPGRIKNREKLIKPQELLKFCGKTEGVCYCACSNEVSESLTEIDISQMQK